MRILLMKSLKNFKNTHSFLENVSCETFEKLDAYASYLREWNAHYNLVQKNTLDVLEERHILDSLQLLPFIKDKSHQILDLGSGAGLPGLILNILDFNVTMIDSNRKKTDFLNFVSLKLELKNTILNERIESLSERFDVITSRACASLNQLCDFSYPVSRETTECFFHKGRMADQEIEGAFENWSFTIEKHQSIIEQDSAILHLKELKPRAHN